MKQRATCSHPCAIACLLPFIFVLGLSLSPIVIGFGLLPVVGFLLVRCGKGLVDWWRCKHYSGEKTKQSLPLV
jgi:hypothetical protein